MNRFLSIIIGVALWPLATAEAGGPLEVDVEIVLAADVSRSMDFAELKIQRDGYSAALSDPAFIRAVEAGMLGRIAITYVEWAGQDRQSVVADWQVVDSAESARAFALRVKATPRDSARGTSISGALDFGLRAINLNAFKGLRRVIDVSGDGPNNAGRPVLLARSDTVSAGVTINGLPLLVPGATVIDNLDDYYADCVIAGPGAFSLPAHGIADFAQAIRRKLILEVSGISPETPELVKAAAPVDCMIGEKLRLQYFDRYYPDL
jgi:hypothetical protein